MKKCILTLFLLFRVIFGQIEKSSLTFVIDDTGSMGDDIEQVKNGVNLIFDTVLHSNASQIEDFVLVTFNDPTTNFRTITKSRLEFKEQLRRIIVYGGGDCEEMSMSGIDLALTKSRPGSYIYVFTDASAKDAHKLEEVKSKAIKFNSQVVFVLTGKCTDDDDDPLYRAYFTLAEATSGQVFHMGKQDVKEILNYVVEQIESPKTTITSKKFPPGSGHKLEFPVDSDMKTVIVSHSGKSPTLDVTAPDGSKPVTKKVVDIPDVKAVRIDDPTPGNYTAVVGSESESSVVVSASTSIKFKHGFSGVQATNIGDTATRPIADVKSYLSIKLVTPDDDKILVSVEIMDIEENLVLELPLEMINKDEKFYSTDKFLPPDFLFKIAIKGLDTKTSTPFKRIGPTPIEVQRLTTGLIENMAPKITTEDGIKIKAEYGERLKISCTIEAYPKPDVIWVDDNNASFSPPVSAVELPYEYISILEIDKVQKNSTYECKASNAVGENSKSIHVETVRKDFFDVLEVPIDTSIEYTKSGQVICKVDAQPPAIISWFKNGVELHTDEHIEISPDGSNLTVKKMQVHSNASYICKAKNDDRTEIFPFKILISGFEKPEIEETLDIVHGNRGTDIELSCRTIKGSPKPLVVWHFKQESSRNFVTLNDTDEVLRIRSLDFHHEGVYACQVYNDAGQDSRTIVLVVDYAPYIEKAETHIKSRHGEPTTLKCVVRGVPKPRVSWFRDDVEVFNDRNYHIYRDNTLRFKGSFENNAKFKCVASNRHGTATRTVQVDYVVPVSIEPPKQSSMEVNFDSNLSLPCRADGYPRPDIKWIFFRDVTNKSIILRPSGSSDVLNLSHLQPYQEGYYTCIARNIHSSANITYQIKVLAKPYIHKSLSKKPYSVVAKDLVLMIPCEATGNPKPVITWTRNGLNIAAGTEWYDIEDDGTLVIKNIDEKSAGTYICQARNKAGEDNEVFYVNVQSYPDSVTPSETIILQRNSTADISCNIPHKRLDYIRWYKGVKLITEGELTLRNIGLSDAGIYTCRVSTFTKSVSSAVAVVVGYPPVFLDDAELTINYEDSIPVFLDCQAEGEPEPKVIWTHNGKQLNSTEMLMDFEMNSETRGLYTCAVSNYFGSITRTFEIISRECFLSIQEDFTQNQPLMVEPNFLIFPQFEITNGYIRISPEETFLLHCPSGFSNFPRSEVIATCDGDKKFKIDGNSFKYSELSCQEEVSPQIKQTGRRCHSGNTETLKIGFELRGEFLEVFEICWDKDKNIPVYAKTRVQRSISDVNPKTESKWYSNDLINLKFSEIYDCDRQINNISSRLGRLFPQTDRCCFNIGKLINPADLPAGLPQKAAFTYHNVVPHWGCGSQNWELLEQQIRNVAKTSYDELVVWTGTAKNLELKNAYSLSEAINLIDSDGHEQAVPQYLWKVVQNPATKSSLAIIQLNIPDVTFAEAIRHMTCRDICRDIPWMARNLEWRDPRKGFTFCCSLSEFESAFRLDGLFGDDKKILQVTSLPPYHSYSY